MILQHPGWLIIIGLILMLVGVILPFLMVAKMIESTFFLNFLAYGSSIGGLLLGIVGVATYSRSNRKR